MADPGNAELKTPLREYSTPPAGLLRKAVMWGSALAFGAPQLLAVWAIEFKPELVTAETLLGWCAVSAGGLVTHIASHKLGRGRQATFAGRPHELTIHEVADLGRRTKGGMGISGDRINRETWSDHYPPEE